jgi:hypothetical protein
MHRAIDGAAVRRPAARGSGFRSHTAALFGLCAFVLLAGCGAGKATTTTTAPVAAAGANDPYVAEPFTHQQKLVALGAQLIVADGCSTCHLVASAKARAPGFASFAGHYVTLAGGQRALVDERFLRNGLLHPERVRIKGYDAAPMIRALAALDLPAHPGRVAALAAFIEEIGPEPG